MKEEKKQHTKQKQKTMAKIKKTLTNQQSNELNKYKTKVGILS